MQYKQCQANSRLTVRIRRFQTLHTASPYRLHTLNTITDVPHQKCGVISVTFTALRLSPDLLAVQVVGGDRPETDWLKSSWSTSSTTVFSLETGLWLTFGLSGPKRRSRLDGNKEAVNVRAWIVLDMGFHLCWGQPGRCAENG